MADLIDREELYKQIRLYLNRHVLGETRADNTLTVGEIAGIISTIPTVNAKIEEIATWRTTPIIADGKEELWIYKCSKYGYIEVKSKEHEYNNYCSNCGRYMDRGN